MTGAKPRPHKRTDYSTRVRCGLCQNVFPSRQDMYTHRLNCTPVADKGREPCGCYMYGACAQHEGDAG